MSYDDEIAAAAAAEAAALEAARADWPQLWTNTPDAYDGFGTETNETTDLYVDGHAGGAYDFPFRRIRCDPAHVQWQCERNNSGAYWTLDTPLWATWLIEGRVAPPPERAPG
jgi:hypothetical protein